MFLNYLVILAEFLNTFKIMAISCLKRFVELVLSFLCSYLVGAVFYFGWCDSDCFPGCYSFCKVLVVCILVVFLFVVNLCLGTVCGL